MSNAFTHYKVSVLVMGIKTDVIVHRARTQAWVDRAYCVTLPV
jgi:hypothetical protein